MNTVLPALLNMSLTGSAVICVVIIARFLLKRAPRKYSYALWAAALFRLLCPFSVSSAVSLFNVAKAPASAVVPAGPVTVMGLCPRAGARELWGRARAGGDSRAGVDHAGPVGPCRGCRAARSYPTPWSSRRSYGSLSPGFSCSRGWCSISACACGSGIRGGSPGAVFLCNNIETAFAVGLLRPRIYLPAQLTERERGVRPRARALPHKARRPYLQAACLYRSEPALVQPARVARVGARDAGHGVELRRGRAQAARRRREGRITPRRS